MSTQTAIKAEMGFAKIDDIIEDHQFPGMLRCKSHPFDADPRETYDFHLVSASDWSQPHTPQPSLDSMGFENIPLTHINGLAAILDNIRQNNEISAEQAKLLRKKLTLSAFPLSNGKKLRFLFIAPEGLIMRKTGPNALQPNPDETMTEMNGHDGALIAHGDQDVNGTPIKQILKGFAPWLFRHKSPNRANQRSPFMLVNLWIPLQQITRPLALMDRRTLDAKHDQLRYALPIDEFLERKQDQTMNDIWAFRFNENQQWYFHSDMDFSQAYVFDTLGEPHGAIILPGETTAEKYYRVLHAAKLAINNNAPDGLKDIQNFKAEKCHKDTPKALKNAIKLFDELVSEAQQKDIQELKQTNWPERCEKALDKVIRKSIEMRVVALVL